MKSQHPLFDITIIGGGPTGLFAAFYAGLRGMRTKIIESLDHLGGQLSTLYPEKFIYDAPGFPAVLARTLAAELTRQAMQYSPEIAFNEQVRQLTGLPDSAWQLHTNVGQHLTRTVLIAIGGGAFTPKRLPGREYAHYEDHGLYYSVTDVADFRRRSILVIGGGDSAIDWALGLHRVANRVILIHRRDRFRAHEATLAKLTASGVDLRTFHQLKALHGQDRVETATIVDNRTGQETTLAVDAVLVNIGFTSSLGPLQEWGVHTDHDGIVVTSRMETNLRGVYAAGDITSYPAKIRLIATGFAEAAVAVNHAKVFIDPESDSFPGHSTTVVPRQRRAAQAQSDLPTGEAPPPSTG